MRPLRVRIVFELILGAVVITSLVLILRQSLRLAELQHRQEADAQSLRLLREALIRKGLQVAPPTTTEVIEPNDHAGIAKREETIERLDRELAEAHASIAALQTDLANANDQAANAQASAQESLQKQQTDSQAQLDDLQKKLTVAITESDIARQRVAALEADNAKLKADNESVASKGSDAAHTIASLQDLDRRRDAYLTSILRRYRDISSDFRAMTGMLDSSHDPNREPNGGACSGAFLGRIQSAVNSAEDDLRQINELNERSQKLAKQLSKK